MDAKPQRIRVRGDENAPIALPAGKTVHQRTKSASALSGVSQNAMIKNNTVNKNNGQRRAAFGDVSNTANPVQGSRDETALAGRKQPSKGTEKPAVKVPEKKPAVLNQPPHRPLSMTGLKGILSHAAQPKAPSKPLEPAGKQMIVSSQQAANARKILTKRGATTVFKDSAQPISENKEITASKETNPDASDESKEVVSCSSTSLSLEEAVDLSKAPARDADDCSFVEASEAGAEDNGDSIIEEEDDCQVQGPQGPKTHDSHHAAMPESHESKLIAPAPPDTIHSQTSALSTGDHESEEYWDEEDEENEEEDDDEYVAARSYRPRGDNTTGVTTTMLVPKYNQQARRELLLAKQIVEATQTEEDIEDEYWDTSMVAEYSDEIFEYMKEQEVKMLPNNHYMDYQVEVQWSMRSILMDWVVQVHYRFSLLPETLYLCVNYIDRFLSCKIISLDRLQLVGATAMFIAAKFEEINCPSVQEIEYMVGGTYSAARIIEAERLMLYVLRFELGYPGPMSFLRRISKADDYDLEIRTLAKYLLEITIMDERFVSSPASFLAAGAHCLARLLLGGNWSPAHVHYSGYTYSQLLPLVSLMLECCENPRKHHAAIYEKYADKRFRHASLFVQGELKYFRLPEAKDNSVFKRNAPLEAARCWDRA